MSAQAIDRLVETGLVSEDVPLAPLVTYRVGGHARYFAEVLDLQSLIEVAETLRSDPRPVLVLGRGSNVVVSDQGFVGLVIRLAGEFIGAAVHQDGSVHAGGGAPLPAVARLAARADRGGLEFLVGIPGTVGGAVRQNAGCHGSEMVDVLAWVELVDLSSCQVVRRDPSELELGYRRSNLRQTHVVTSVGLRTTARPRRESEHLMREITTWRRLHQPGGTHNAGSVFKNPEGDAAGRIIDELGLKGFRVGRVAVSEKHANFFVAEEGATAQEVFELVTAVREKVRAASGVDLVPEIGFVGDFSEGIPDDA